MLNKHSSRVYYAPGPVLVVVDTAVNKTKSLSNIWIFKEGSKGSGSLRKKETLGGGCICQNP